MEVLLRIKELLYHSRALGCVPVQQLPVGSIVKKA
jgi:hypothetical protein